MRFQKRQVGGTSPVKVNGSGTINAEFDLSAAGGYTAYGQIYINGLVTGSVHLSTSTATMFSLSVFVNSRDLVRGCPENLF